MVIDMHVHCFPDKLAPKVIPKLAHNAGIPSYADGTISGLKASMAKAGVDKSVLQPIATKPEQTDGINRWATGVQDGQIISFGSIHPDYVNYEDEIQRLKEAGVKGIKFHPHYQDFYVDDKKLFRLYDALVQSGFIMLFHAGDDPCYPPLKRCTPSQLKNISRQFPHGVIIAAHMGGYRHWNEALEVLAGSGIYIDTSFSYDEMGAAGMKKMIEVYGASQVLFATDSPWEDQKLAAEHIYSLGLDSSSTDDIMGGNAARLLGL